MDFSPGVGLILRVEISEVYAFILVVIQDGAPQVKKEETLK